MELKSFQLLLFFCVIVNFGQCGLFGVPSIGYKILTFDPPYTEHPPVQKLEKKILSCYYNVPTMYDRPFPVYPEQIDPHLCTHINIAFARVDNCTLLPGSNLDIEFYNRTIKLKQKNPELKILISVGGAAFSRKGFDIMMSTNVSRMRFIETAISFMDSYGFDGIDLDWEFPAAGLAELTENPSQKIQFAEFFKEFRKHAENIKKSGKYILTAAVGALKSTIDTSYDVPKIAESLDFINLMTYDFHYFDKFTPFTGPNSPLHNISTEFGALATMNTEWAAKYWIQNGMPKNKIVLGMPTYGRTYRLVDEQYHGYYNLANGVAKSVGSNGYTSHSEACEFRARNKSTTVFDSESREAYSYNGNDWITIANEQSTIEKAQFVMTMGLGGVGIYDINSDDAWMLCTGSAKKFPIIQSARNTLQIGI